MMSPKVLIKACLVITLAIGYGTVLAADLTEEHRLMNDLFANYSKDLKPTRDAKTKITVDVSFSLARVEGLNEKDQVLTTFGWIIMMWRDELLVWNPKDYGGIRVITVPYTRVWIPEVAMLNSVTQGNDLGFESKFRMNVDSNGGVQWGPGFKWETSCSIDLVYFPFDQHTCHVEFVNWVYGGDRLEYTSFRPDVSFTLFTDNPAWSIVNSTANATTVSIIEIGLEFQIPKVSFSLTLKRNPTFHLWNVLVPSLLMTVMSLFVYILPCDSGEKVGLSITILLGYSVILLMVSDITPQSGDSMPLISIYIVLSMGITACSLVLTLVVLNAHHHSPRKPPPATVCKLVLRLLGTLVCMRKPRLDLPPTAVSPQMNGEVTILQDLERKVNNCNRPMIELPASVLAYINKKIEDDKENDITDHHREQWQHIANILDRLFLIMSSLLVAVMMAAFVGNIVQH